MELFAYNESVLHIFITLYGPSVFLPLALRLLLLANAPFEHMPPIEKDVMYITMITKSTKASDELVFEKVCEERPISRDGSAILIFILIYIL